MKLFKKEYYESLFSKKPEKDKEAELKEYCESWIRLYQHDPSEYNSGAFKVARKILIILGSK